ERILAHNKRADASEQHFTVVGLQSVLVAMRATANVVPGYSGVRLDARDRLEQFRAWVAHAVLESVGARAEGDDLHVGDLHAATAVGSAGRRSAQGATDSNAAARRSTSASAKRWPTIWSPTGRFCEVQPHGTLIAGTPFTLNGYVNGNQL